MTTSTRPDAPERGTPEPPRRPGRPRRPAPFGDPPRRPLAAGHAVIVVFIALTLAALFNAHGLRKATYIKPQGWEREFGLAVFTPLARVSHALLLDRPREGLKALLGRSEDDEIDTEFTLPTPSPTARRRPPGTARGVRSPAPPPKPAFTPRRKLSVWVAGDSLAVTPGQSILRFVDASRVMRAVGPVDGRLATGLERPDVFNWFDRIEDMSHGGSAKAVILAFGANDDHSYMTGLPRGVDIDGFGTRSWEREYRRRVAGVMDTVIDNGGYVFWIGPPITRSPDQSRRFAVLSRIYRTEAAKRQRAYFIDTQRLFRGASGGYADYLTDARGRLVRVRAPDGVHFERAGGDRIAREVLIAFRRAFDLTGWRRRARPASPDGGGSTRSTPSSTGTRTSGGTRTP